MQDSELAELAARGDQEAFERLVHSHRSAIYGLAYKITLNEDDALDVTQEVFLRLATRIGSYNGRGSFRSFVLTITTREAINVMRGRGRKEHPTEPSDLERMIDGSGAHHGAGSPDLEHSERMAAVEGAMHHLSARQRAVLSLRLKESMDLRQIGEELNISYGQVRTQLSLAVSKLRQILAKERNDV